MGCDCTVENLELSTNNFDTKNVSSFSHFHSSCKKSPKRWCAVFKAAEWKDAFLVHYQSTLAALTRQAMAIKNHKNFPHWRWPEAKNPLIWTGKTADYGKLLFGRGSNIQLKDNNWLLRAFQASNTHGNPGSTLNLQNDGNMVSKLCARKRYFPYLL